MFTDVRTGPDKVLEGGVFLTFSTMNSFAVSTDRGLGFAKFMTLFLLVFEKTQ